MLNGTMSDDEPILSHSSEGEESEIDVFEGNKRPFRVLTNQQAGAYPVKASILRSVFETCSE